MFNVQLVIKIHKRSSPWQVSDAAYEEGQCCMNWALYISAGTDGNHRYQHIQSLNEEYQLLCGNISYICSWNVKCIVSIWWDGHSWILWSNKGVLFHHFIPISTVPLNSAEHLSTVHNKCHLPIFATTSFLHHFESLYVYVWHICGSIIVLVTN
jgi:hypothetical protein